MWRKTGESLSDLRYRDVARGTAMCDQCDQSVAESVVLRSVTGVLLLT